MGIPVRLHWTFLVMIYMVVSFASSQGDAKGPLIILGITFGSVFLHELGHSLMARRLGIRVLDITFWPLGGMARMSHMPEDARVEGLVAGAGPLVNFVLASIGVLFLPLGASAALAPIGWADLLIRINLLIGTFNLIPAFPMDGGRILRACLARKNNWLEATEGAVKVGRFFAGLMLFGSLVYGFYMDSGGLCMMPLIVGFIWISGAKELMAVRLRHGVNPLGQMGGFRRSSFGAAHGEQQAGAPFAAEWHGTSPAPGREQTLEWDEVRAQRPEAWSEAAPEGGFTEEDIKRLEGFHGRILPKPGDEEL